MSTAVLDDVRNGIVNEDDITKERDLNINNCNKSEDFSLPEDQEEEDDSDMPPLEDRVLSATETKENETKDPGKRENTLAVNPETVNNDKENDRTDSENTLKEEYLDILGNGLLKRKVIKEGDTKTSRPEHGDMVTVRTSGQLEDHTVVDVEDSVTFTLGDGDVIQAWDLGVALMSIGQIIELITDARYAYGELGRKPDIPSNSSITYTIELLSKEPPQDLETLSVSERLTMGEKKRERGNYLFARNDYIGAINSYSKAVKILDPESCSESAENLQHLLENRLKCYNNMAACQLKTGVFDAAKKSCMSVLDVQPENVKALFRMGKACAGKGETREAVQYLRKAQKQEPDTKIINQELFKLSKKLSAETENEKNMYQKMLGTKPTPSKSKGSPSQSKTWLWPLLGATTIGLVGAGIAAYRHIQH